MEAIKAFEAAKATAWRTAADPALLELCRIQVAALLGDGPALEGEFDEAQRAHLDFAEQFVTHVAGITDADVDRLLQHDEPIDVYRFISALYVLEFSRRFELVTAAVLA